MTDKSPFTKNELEAIEAMVKFDGDIEKAAAYLGIDTGIINKRFFRVRQRFRKAQLIVNTVYNWRKQHSCIRKRLTL